MLRRTSLQPVVHQHQDSPWVEQLLQQQQTAPPEPPAPTPPAPPAPPAPAPTPPDPALTEGGHRALQAERARANEAERKLAEYERQNDAAASAQRTQEAITAAVQAALATEQQKATEKMAPLLAGLVMEKARAAAQDAGVQPGEPGKDQPDRVTRFLGNCDLTGLVADDGTVNGEELKKRVTAGATANPEFVTGPAAPRVATPGGPQGGGQSRPTAPDLKTATDSALNTMLKTLGRSPDGGGAVTLTPAQAQALRDIGRK